jgi:hypothetical protein
MIEEQKNINNKKEKFNVFGIFIIKERKKER